LATSILTEREIFEFAQVKLLSFHLHAVIWQKRVGALQSSQLLFRACRQKRN
jgi:hypothetical protein